MASRINPWWAANYRLILILILLVAAVLPSRERDAGREVEVADVESECCGETHAGAKQQGEEDD